MNNFYYKYRSFIYIIFTFSSLTLSVMFASNAASVWNDEDHVIQNRDIYKKKYKFADQIFDDFDGYLSPEAGFFLWLNVGDGQKTALELWQNCGVRVLPGRYLAKDLKGQSPGDRFIRIAMVSELRKSL